MMPAGLYYVGDLCYVMHEVWDEVCGIMFNQSATGNDGEFTLKDGRRFAVYGTRWGDGSYKDQFGHSYSVDAGIIGCILDSDIDYLAESSWGSVNDHDGGQLIEFTREFRTGIIDGSVIEIGHIMIDTDAEYEEEPDVDEAQEWHDFDSEC
jgi:hypothetical protein